MPMKKASQHSKAKRTSRTNRIRTPRRRYTPREQQVIRDLADQLGKLLPATSQGPFSLKGLSKQRGLARFFNDKLTSKKAQFVHFITEVHRAKPRTLKPFINDLLADAVARRRGAGNPVLREEADALKVTLKEFGIDLSKEIDELQLPVTRPHVAPPPVTIVQGLERLGLHPLLLDRALPLFKDGHTNDAVRKSGEVLEAAVMRWAGTKTKRGRDLMSYAFSGKAPVIDVAKYHGGDLGDEVDEREGFMFLAMGAMQWCKNIVGHGDVPQLAPADAASRIVLISHLLCVAEATVRGGEEV